MLLHPLTNFEIQRYYKMNLNLMVFIRRLIYLKWVDTNQLELIG